MAGYLLLSLLVQSSRFQTKPLLLVIHGGIKELAMTPDYRDWSGNVSLCTGFLCGGGRKDAPLTHPTGEAFPSSTWEQHQSPSFRVWRAHGRNHLRRPLIPAWKGPTAARASPMPRDTFWPSQDVVHFGDRGKAVLLVFPFGHNMEKDSNELPVVYCLGRPFKNLACSRVIASSQAVARDQVSSVGP